MHKNEGLRTVKAPRGLMRPTFCLRPIWSQNDKRARREVRGAEDICHAWLARYPGAATSAPGLTATAKSGWGVFHVTSLGSQLSSQHFIYTMSEVDLAHAYCSLFIPVAMHH